MPDGQAAGRPIATERVGDAILARPEQAATIRRAIDAWNRGEQTLALIALVHLGELKIKTEAQVQAELAKAGFDPSQPRDDNGQWTSEGRVRRRMVAAMRMAVRM